MEGSHTSKVSIYMYVLPWKAAKLEMGLYTCTLLAWGCHLEPSQQPNRQAPFYLCFHGNQSRFSQDVGNSCSLTFTAIYCFAIYIPADHIFFASEKKLDFFFLLMPSFSKAKTFAKCPSVYKDLLLFIFAFPMNNSCEHFFYLLCNGGRRLPTAVHLPPWI